MVFLAVIGVLALAFIVALILSSRNLTVAQILLWIGLFLTTIAFMFVSSVVMAAHAKWKKSSADLQKEIVAAEKTRDTLTRGNSSVRAVAQKLNVEVVGAGQIWNNLIVENIDPNGIVLNSRVWGLDRCVGQPDEGGALEPVPAAEETPAAEGAPADGEAAADGAAAPADGAAAPADGAAAPAEGGAAPAEGGAAPAGGVPAGKPTGLQPNMEVFAFREVPVFGLPEPLQGALFRQREEWVQEQEPFFNEETRKAYCRLPLVYLGRFRVAGVAGPNVTLVAMDELTPARIEKINFAQRGTTWALFEKLPADSLQVYSGMTREQLAALAAVAMQGVPPQQIEAWLAEVLATGSPVQPGQSSPEALVSVQFLKPHTVEVDAGAVDPSASQPYDASGRAISAAYVAGQPTVFQEGDQAELDPATAQALEQQQIVKRVNVVSSRMLRDYRTLYSVISDRSAELNDLLGVAQRDLTIIQEANQKLQAQQTALTEESSRLKQDTQSLGREHQVLGGYLQQLRQRSEQLKAQVSKLYQENVRLRQELAARQGVN
ncbi:MAG: hypothetical protein U0795_03205 [Pirellulales bacterium]